MNGSVWQGTADRMTTTPASSKINYTTADDQACTLDVRARRPIFQYIE